MFLIRLYTKFIKLRRYWNVVLLFSLSYGIFERIWIRFLVDLCELVVTSIVSGAVIN